MIRYTLLLLVAILGFAPAAVAQSPPLRPGNLVRLTTPMAKSEFVFLRLGPESMVVRDSVGTTVDVPLESVRRIEVFRRGSGIGGPVGGVLGLAAGGVIGFLIGYSLPADGSWEDLERAGHGMIGGLLLGGAGLVAGVVIGSRMTDDQWEPVSVPRGPRTWPGRARGINVGFVLRF